MNSRPRKTCFSTPRAQVSLPCHALLGSNYLFSVRFVYAERFPELRSTNSDSRVEQPTRVKHMKKGSSLLSTGKSRFSSPSFIFLTGLTSSNPGIFFFVGYQAVEDDKQAGNLSIKRMNRCHPPSRECDAWWERLREGA
jgi:hypothetical protein